MLPLKDTSSPSPPFAQGTNFVMEIGVTTTCVEGAAARLGLKRTTLIAKMRKLGLVQKTAEQIHQISDALTETGVPLLT